MIISNESMLFYRVRMYLFAYAMCGACWVRVGCPTLLSVFSFVCSFPPMCFYSSACTHTCFHAVLSAGTRWVCASCVPLCSMCSRVAACTRHFPHPHAVLLTATALCACGLRPVPSLALVCPSLLLHKSLCAGPCTLTPPKLHEPFSTTSLFPAAELLWVVRNPARSVPLMERPSFPH